MATHKKHGVTLTWGELSGILSKAHVLCPEEDIANLTLIKPRALLIATNRTVKATTSAALEEL